jgi:hypothetical protein
MQNKWYGDDLDIVKWGILFSLAKKYRKEIIIQVAYYRQAERKKFYLEIDKTKRQIPDEIVTHFSDEKDLRNICGVRSSVEVALVPDVITTRKMYQKKSN